MYATCLHVLIRGKVQGVFFRASAKELADRLALSGWVKNTDEGHVEVFVSGGPDAINQFMAWCHKGPAGSRVDEVKVLPPDDAQEKQGFVILC